jgi:hypothetical protein
MILQRRYLPEVKIARVEPANFDKFLPILDRWDTVAKIDSLSGSQALKCAIDGGDRHVQRLAQLKD